MGRRQSLRTTLLFSLVATAIWSVVLVYTDGGTWTDAAIRAPLFFAMIFFTMLASNRLTSWLANRIATREAAKAAASRGPAVVPPSSERADHNQRRRQRADRARAERRRRQ
ncbi:MAG: hypothetical protein WC273_10555 [Dehalococcoidia bacterium]